MPEVGIILGSDSDLPKVARCFETLEKFSVSFEIVVSSAHRTPDDTRSWVISAPERGIKVLIAVAGGAAHLPGVVASHTCLPVIGVPIESTIAGGLDSILSILQMPSGIPVATMPAGKAGGANAALYAVRILAVADPAYHEKMSAYREEMAASVRKKNQQLSSVGYKEYIAQFTS
jgi:5-(carboxyamino)imidazole ribonucleotide mutase